MTLRSGRLDLARNRARYVNPIRESSLISSCMPVGRLDGFVKYVNNFNGVDVVACNIFLRALGYA